MLQEEELPHPKGVCSSADRPPPMAWFFPAASILPEHPVSSRHCRFPTHPIGFLPGPSRNVHNGHLACARGNSVRGCFASYRGRHVAPEVCSQAVKTSSREWDDSVMNCLGILPRSPLTGPGRKNGLSIHIHGPCVGSVIHAWRLLRDWLERHRLNRLRGLLHVLWGICWILIGDIKLRGLCVAHLHAQQQYQRCETNHSHRSDSASNSLKYYL